MLRKVLALIAACGLALTLVSQAPAANKMMFAGGYAPAVYTDFTAINSTLPPSLYGYSGPSLRTITDATGAITYAPNNLLTYSNTITNGAWTKVSITVTVGVADPFGGTNASTITSTGALGYIYQSKPNTNSGLNAIWIKRRTGTAVVSLSTPGNVDITQPVTSSWTQFYTSGAPFGVQSYLVIKLNSVGDAVDIYGATISVVTYETSPRPGDQVITTSAAYYGPAFDINAPSASVPASGLRDEATATNLYLNSGAPATQTMTVVDGTTYTGSILGTGTQAFTGAFTATLIGAAGTLTQTTQAAATVTSLVATDTGLTSTAFPQVEVGSFATSRIITGVSAVSRAADVIGITGFLASLATTNPIIVERQSIATGAISRTLYTKNTFAFATGYWYRKLIVCPASDPTARLTAIAGTTQGPLHC